MRRRPEPGPPAVEVSDGSDGDGGDDGAAAKQMAPLTRALTWALTRALTWALTWAPRDRGWPVLRKAHSRGSGVVDLGRGLLLSLLLLGCVLGQGHALLRTHGRGWGTKLAEDVHRAYPGHAVRRLYGAYALQNATFHLPYGGSG